MLLVWALSVYAQPRLLTPVAKTSWYQLGDKRINVKISQYGSASSGVIVNLHHNETTSLQAAKAFLAVNGGILINIENRNERLISFSVRERRFRFDPNRIFTDAGIRLTLRRHSAHVTPAAIKAVKRFAVFLKSRIPPSAKTIIAVHNNEDGEFSVNSYVAGGDLQKEAQLVHVEPDLDADNFFLTTNAALFRKLKNAGYNVVLQQNKKVSDDGSMSVFYARRKPVYVNVEAEKGQYAEQLAMLETLFRILD